MRINIADGRYLVISDLMVTRLTKFRQIDNNNERGGVLVGKILEDGSEYHITDFSIPTNLDESTRTSFTRSKISAQDFIDDKWKETEGYVNYIGEWHTHPAKLAQPSIMDMKVLSNSFKKNKVHSDCLFMIILSHIDSYILTKNDYIGYCHKKNKILKEIVFDNER